MLHSLRGDSSDSSLHSDDVISIDEVGRHGFLVYTLLMSQKLPMSWKINKVSWPPTLFYRYHNSEAVYTECKWHLAVEICVDAQDREQARSINRSTPSKIHPAQRYNLLQL